MGDKNINPINNKFRLSEPNAKAGEIAIEIIIAFKKNKVYFLFVIELKKDFFIRVSQFFRNILHRKVFINVIS